MVFFATEAGVFLYQCTPYLAWALIKLTPYVDQIVGLHDARRYTTRDATQFRAMPGPLTAHTQTQRGTVCGDDDTPLHT